MSSWIVGFFMVMVNLIVGQIYVVINGGEFIGLFDSFKMIGIVILSIMSFSSLFFYLSLFMKTTNSFGLLSTMVSTFIGFLGGIYIQIGLMPKTVQSIMNMLPTAHAVTLIRRIYMNEAINGFFVDQSINEYDYFMNDMGLNANIFGYTLSSFEMVLSLVAFGLLFYILSAIKLSKSKL
jgi:multidrug/hemolysin transport system permease protein